MGDDLPLLTMVKSKEIDEKPIGLSKDSIELLNTLSSLCSFYSVEDFVGFIFSEKFQVLVGDGEPWVVFEIGMYLDHQKNMQLIATDKKVILVDNVKCGWNDGIFESNDRVEILKELHLWCELVFNPKSRFE
tara:strand:- start:505 stop:900 length:396 start_codon:yes stop_codon:yes gene_type:complete